MVDVNVDFIFENEQPINADFQLEPDVTYTADIKLSEATRDHTKLYNRDEANQHPMSAITGLEDALNGLSDDITAEYNRAIEAEESLDNKIDLEVDTRIDEITRVEGLISDEETRAKGVEQDLKSSIDSNHQAISNHVSNKNNPHEVTKAQVGLGNVENIAPADMPISTATQTALNTKVDKVSTADRVYGTDAQGNQTTYDKGSFGQVDDVQVGGVSVVTNKVAELGTMAGESVSDYTTTSDINTALALKQDNLTAGNGIDITSDTVSVTDPTIVNNGTGTKALAMGKTSQSTAEGGVAVGYGARANSTYGTAVGYDSRANNTNTTAIGKQAKASNARSIAIGSGAEANADDAIAIKGVNNTANTFQVYTYNMLDMSTGLIPDARISTNIARASDIPTNYVTTDTAQTITGTKTFHNCAIESDNFITLTSPNAYVRYSGSGVVRSLLRRNSSGTVEVGSSNDTVKIQGSATRPAYNSSDLALYSDVTSGDSALQSQIDALVVASDVFDIVGTYAELQAYDISTVPVNDIIKVLVDSTHDGAATYYRCVENNNVKSWSYIGSEGAYYTKGEADNRFVPQTRTVNSKALSSDITLTASDVGALPSSTVIPTVNNGQLDIQVNGSSVATFTANQSGNTTANIVVPNSATWGNVTGDIADQTDLQDALDEKQDILSGGRYIEIVSGGTIATLPEGCKQVEYITATGTQHLDTLITATNDYEIRAKFRLTELNDSFLYGARQAYGVSSFALHKNYAPFSTDVGTGYVNLGVDSWYNVKQNKNGIYINELLAHAYNNSLASFTTPNTIRVFAMAQGNNALYGTTFMKGDFASFEIYNNGVLVCNLVPCIDSNDVACMYDTVNERFLYNLGTGNFTAGAEVVPSDTINCTLDGSDINTLLGYTPVNPSSLATVATSGDYDDLTNKPTIPTVNNATLTIQKNGVDVQTFTANASSNVTANISVPTDTGDLTNNAGFITGISSGDVTTALGYTPVNPTSLATVATSGLYSDLTGTPTIPTVDQTYDGTSSNAQSGLAVASAISTKQDSATALTTTNTYYSNNTLYIG